MKVSFLHLEKNYIEIKYQSKDCINDLIKSINDLIVLENLPKHLVILTDSNECEFKISYEDTELIAEIMSLLAVKCNSIKQAIITENPQHTAMMSIVIEKLKSTSNYYLKVFCTKEGARNFLLTS